MTPKLWRIALGSDLFGSPPGRVGFEVGEPVAGTNPGQGTKALSRREGEFHRGGQHRLAPGAAKGQALVGMLTSFRPAAVFRSRRQACLGDGQRARHAFRPQAERRCPLKDQGDEETNSPPNTADRLSSRRHHVSVGASDQALKKRPRRPVPTSHAFDLCTG